MNVPSSLFRDRINDTMTLNETGKFHNRAKFCGQCTSFTHDAPTLGRKLLLMSHLISIADIVVYL
jgi:hypothetical protein